ncbi:MAG TPA: HEAT repeat domain-containing protein [Gemmatimonadaceae bacterium]
MTVRSDARRLLGACAILLPASLALSTAAAPRSAAAAEVRASAARRVAKDPADSLYRAAQDALNKSDYHRAADLFAELTRRYPSSDFAADALYWRAFALYRAGREDDLREALKSLETQRTTFPRATTSADAAALAVRIRGSLARRGDAPSAEAVSSAATAPTRCVAGRDDDEDVRTAAMNALLQMDAEQAVPIIKQVLQRRDACSVNLRRKAMFLLSQKHSPETETLLMEAIRSDPDAEVREQAVFWLGQVHSDKAAEALEEIATRSPDRALREKAVFALGQQGTPRGTALVRRLAESPDTPESVREQAIFQLGQRRSAENAEFLRGLFTRLGKGDRNDELRKRLLFSLSQMRGVGNDRWLLSVALDTSEHEEVRKHALFSAGQAGVSATDLVPLYDRFTDREIKGQLIWVLSESRDRAASDKLIDIARNDRDPEMRKKAIFWLGQKNDPRVRQLLLDIINKE